MVAALLLLAGVLMPWSEEVGSTAVPAGSTAIVLGAGSFLAGLRMWRTRRRWVAITGSGVATVAGVVAAGVATATLLLLQVRNSGPFGPGLFVIFAGGVLVAAFGHEALTRLRRDPRHWDRRLRDRSL
jgi:peptidoglycan/LPS O-acetylase OafA/YrhL